MTIATALAQKGIKYPRTREPHRWDMLPSDTDIGRHIISLWTDAASLRDKAMDVTEEMDRCLSRQSATWAYS